MCAICDKVPADDTTSSEELFAAYRRVCTTATPAERAAFFDCMLESKMKHAKSITKQGRRMTDFVSIPDMQPLFDHDATKEIEAALNRCGVDYMPTPRNWEER